MIESLTIFTKSGIVLYQHQVNKSTLSTSTSSSNIASTNATSLITTKDTIGVPSTMTKNSSSFQSAQGLSNFNRDLLNQFITSTLLGGSMSSSKQQQTQQTILYPNSIGTNSTSTGSNGIGNASTMIKTGMVADWEYFSATDIAKSTTNSSVDKSPPNDDKENVALTNFHPKQAWIAVAFYSEVLLHRKDMSFVKRFLRSVLKDYALFYDKVISTSSNPNPLSYIDETNAQLFDKTCLALWKQMERYAKQKQQQLDKNASTSTTTTKESSSSLSATNRNSSSNSLKKKTVWHDGKGKITKASLAQLDRSKDASNTNLAATDSIEAAMADDSVVLREARSAYLPSSDEIPSWLENEEETTLDDGPDKNQSSSASSWSFQSLFDQMSGNKILTEQDLEIPLKEMERMLISKNVAQEIAKEICQGVTSKLVGMRMHTFSRVKSTVRSALEHSIAQILSPHRDIDLLRQVISKRDSSLSSYFRGNNTNTNNKPYVIVMVGINGVGKSTSLAKIAYFLKTNGCSPLLAACDTFRSGAVEQLGVHAKCLDVPLYHKGYAKDPSMVAKAAIASATESNHDVVLIDTAGRMQNNLPLMKALRKLIAENNPDLVVFVGEALVGNDGLNQLQMFDKALSSEGRGDGKHGVDGIILSKFDTVGEKVGAALSMVKFSGKAVLFAGVGQKYGHLKKLSVNSIIKSLFS